MGFKFVSVAILAAVFAAGSLQAQSVGQIGGPANPPPAGFKGQQFVDNRGCVFLKAGYGGQSTWVPRVGRDRKAMCGFPPTGQTRGNIEIATAEDMAKPAAPVMAAPVMEAPVVEAPVMAAPVVKAPVVQAQAPTVVTTAPARVASSYAPTYKPAPRVVAAAPVARQPAPYVEAAPRGTYETAASNGPGRGQIGCYASAPVAERVKLRNGGTAVVCTRGDGTLTGWRPPVQARSAGVGASLTDPVTGHAPGHKTTGHAGTYGGGTDSAGAHGGTYAGANDDAIPTPPKGYKMAWNDDRLNPNRGKGTLNGWQDQEQVWTHDIPAQLQSEQKPGKRQKKVVYVTKKSTVTVSTKGQPATAPVRQKPVAKGGAYIQVGTFGVASNADGAASRLRGAGLPVARANVTKGGKALQIVLAGPFRTAEDAQVALSMARRAGFGDAFIR